MLGELFNKNGKLEKLTITAFSDCKRSIPVSGVKFMVMFNPDKYARQYEWVYKTKNASGKEHAEQVYQQVKSQTLSFQFLIDGTGTASEKVDVKTKIGEFLKVATGFAEGKKRPYYLQLKWGTEIWKCVLTGADINYTMFKPGGEPLRASIKANFREDSCPPKKEKSGKAKGKTASLLTVKKGDSLAGLTIGQYGSSAKVAEVAKANNLDSLRSLLPGVSLLLPPF